MNNNWGFSVLDPTTTCELSVAYGVVPSELAPPLLPATREGAQSCLEGELDTFLQKSCSLHPSMTWACFFFYAFPWSCVKFCWQMATFNPSFRTWGLLHSYEFATGTTLERLSPWLLLWDVKFQWKWGIRGRHGRNPGVRDGQLGGIWCLVYNWFRFTLSSCFIIQN